MTGTSSFPSQDPHETLVVFILVGCVDVLGPHWRDSIRCYIGPLLDRLCEGNPHGQPRVEFVKYCYRPPVLFDPSHVLGGHDEMRGLSLDGTITGRTLDVAAYRGYVSIIEMIDRFQKPNENSYHLWHIAVGQHDNEYPCFDVLPSSWGPKWQDVRGDLMERNINLSMVLANSCPTLLQLFLATPSRMRTQPWFDTNPDHMVLLSGFVPPEVTVPISSSTTLAHGLQYMTNNQWSGTSTSQLAGSDPYLQVTTTVPDLNLYEVPQASSPIVVQTESHVPGAQGPALMSWSVSTHNSGVEQQQPMPHDYTMALNASGDLANTSADPVAQEVFREMSGDGWAGKLYLGDVCVYARARTFEVVGNPKLSEWPEDLQLELVADYKISTLDIQAWMRKTKASMARLKCIYETDKCKCDFHQLIETLSDARGYSIVRWGNQGQTPPVRLLLVPAGKVLLCAASPDEGILERPKSRPPQPIRVTSPRVKKPKVSRKKKESQPEPQSSFVAMSMSPEGPYPEAAPNGVAPPQRMPEQLQEVYYPPRAMESTQPGGGPHSEGQVNTFAHPQTMRRPQLQLEQPPYPQAPRHQRSVTLDGAMDVDGGLGGWSAGAGAASRAAYPTDIDSGTRDADAFESTPHSNFGIAPTAISGAFDMSEYIDFGHYDRAS